jgi:hypothetical protein
MSEHQYHEFLAAARPLDAAAQDELRNISTRARIGSTSFVNSSVEKDVVEPLPSPGPLPAPLCASALPCLPVEWRRRLAPAR